LPRCRNCRHSLMILFFTSPSTPLEAIRNTQQIRRYITDVSF
jgi:hypothetical protein